MIGKIKKRKKAITLIEIMIVILLIGLIGGVLAYNLKGSLDEGKNFKSEQGARQLRNILLWEVAKGHATMDDIVKDWETVLDNSPLAGKAKDLKTDGWGVPYSVQLNENNDDIIVESSRQKQERPLKQ